MMPLPHKAVALFAFTTALAGSLVAFPLILDNPAFALDSTGSTAGHEHHMMMPSDMVEARIAYAKTALKIIDAQTQQWNAVADVLRKQAKARDAEILAMRAKYDMHRDGNGAPDGHPSPANQGGQGGQADQGDHGGGWDHDGQHVAFNAIDHLEMREKMMTERAADLQELIAAAKPLYASLSDDQKEIANHLLMHGMEHHEWGGHGGWEHGPR